MLSISHLIVVLVIVLVLFGAGKIPNIMGDVGKGIRNFRKSIKDEAADKSKIIDQDKTDQDKNN